MNRREFLKTLGLTAAAVSFAPSALADAPAVPPIAAIDEAALDEVLYVGDVFTIAGRYAVNPITGKTTSHLQRFIVTSVTSDRAELGFHPSLKTNTETWPKLNSDEVFGRRKFPELRAGTRAAASGLGAEIAAGFLPPQNSPPPSSSAFGFRTA